MFIGHFGAALAAKRLAPSVSLGWLLVGAQLPDLIYPVLSLMGVESGRLVAPRGTLNPYAMHYPWSHSLATGFTTAGVFAVLFWMFHRGSTARTVLTLGFVACSHLGLDFFTHQHLPLAPATSLTLGLGLGDRVALAAGLEFLLLLGGCCAYLLTVRKTALGYLLFGTYTLTLCGLYASALVNPSPESSPGLTASVLVMNLVLLGWGTAVDRLWNLRK